MTHLAAILFALAVSACTVRVHHYPLPQPFVVRHSAAIGVGCGTCSGWRQHEPDRQRHRHVRRKPWRRVGPGLR